MVKNIKQLNAQSVTSDSILALHTAGWIHDSLGQYRSGGQIKEKTGFSLYIRRRNLQHFIDDFNKKSSTVTTPEPHKYTASVLGSTPSMGNPKPKLTPQVAENCSRRGTYYKDCNLLPTLSAFSDYPSLKATYKSKPCLLIGYDSEWDTLPAGREMLSWQFALVDKSDLVEFVFIKNGADNLSLSEALSCILDHLGYNSVDTRSLRKYKYCTAWHNNKPVVAATTNLDLAHSKCKYAYRSNVGFTHELICNTDINHRKDLSCFYTYIDYTAVNRIKVCLVCHAGKVDLSALKYDKRNVLPRLTDIQGGLVSLQPIHLEPHSMKSVNNTYIYPVSLSVADTMCHAPAGKKKLKDLGEVIGIEKVEISITCKEHMHDFLSKSPVNYMEYASTDSVVTVLYASALYGYNNVLPVTITSASADVVKESVMQYFNCKSIKDFNHIYRGLENVNHGKFKIKDRPAFVEGTNLEPISNDANAVQYYASQAYHGGYNICNEVGYFPFETYDYDLKNAYPTAMCLVPDINWDSPIRNEIIHRDMSLSDFAGIGGINPISPFVGYIRFEFPATCKFPSIPINVDGVPAYPLSSEGLNGVYSAGPFIWLALKLGAHVYCDRGYFLNVRYVKDFSIESRSLATAVKQLVVDRTRAKQEKGKGSLEELILKVMVNCVYGKCAQNVIQKALWSAMSDVMEDIGCSCITNPVSAMMITSIVQVELLAAQNQINDLGYMSCSVTTDGFISDCPMSTLNSLDLYGLKKYVEASRIYLTNGNPQLWEVKHHQDDLINFTTRGNVSLHCKSRDGYDGVCAHNSTKSGYEPDSYEDRLWLMTKVLSRNGTIDYTDYEWTSFKDIVQDKPFVIKPETRHIRMDFDLKRKPLRSSFKTDTVIINGLKYEIAHFDTVPYRTIYEFRLYRDKKKLTKVLRTESDWDNFEMKLQLDSCNAQPRDKNWAILNTCIMGYRSGCWDIPSLNNKSIEEKCKWINTHNNSSRIFKPNDWKNARRPERLANMLPTQMIESKLAELINDSK